MVRLIVGILIFMQTASCMSEDGLERFLDRSLKGRPGCVVVYSLKDKRIIGELGDSISLCGLHPPGSLVKIISALAALDEKIVNWDYRVKCDNRFEWGDTVYNCCFGGGHGEVDMEKALMVSCNYFFYSLVPLGLTIDMVVGHSEYFGFDNPPIFRPELPSGKLPDNSIDPFRAVIGLWPSGITVYHVLQMAIIMAAFDRAEFLPGETVGYIQCNISNFYRVRDALKRGELPNSRIRYGGKTGTPSVPVQNGRTHAWFTGWAPFDEPEYAIVVFLRDGYGSRDAEPIAREVLSELLIDSN